MGRIFFVCKTSFLYLVLLCLFTPSLIHAAGNYEIYVAKGIQKINEGSYNEAVEMLEKAADLAPDDQEVVYYSAVAYSRTGNYEKAENLFLRMLGDDPSVVNVYMELGRIYYIHSECANADKYLSELIALTEDTALKSYAQSMLDDCGEQKTATRDSMFNVTLTLGGQYDNNVILEAKNPTAVTNNKKADGRILAFLSTRAMLYENEFVKLNADYNIYHSMHESLDDYNVHNQKISPYIEILGLPDMFRPTVGYSFEYTKFGGEHYSNLHGFFTNLVVKEGEGLATELSYKYTDNKFFDSPLFLTNSTRSGDTSSFGIAQRFTIKDIRAKVYYSGDIIDTSTSDLDYDSDGIGAELSYTFAEPIKMNVKFAAEHDESRYKANYPGSGFSRMDKNDTFNVTLTYLGYKKVAVSLVNSYSVNDSNISAYEYERNITGLFLTMRIL